jgi:hypothetical protein
MKNEKIFHRDEGDKRDLHHQVLVTKVNCTAVLLGSNFCRAFLSISFIPFIPVIPLSDFSHPPTS